MCSASVRPEVFNDGEDEILQLFYDEFQKHTTAYKSDVYSFEKFKTEYYKMAHTLWYYCGVFGGVFVESALANGYLDPAQPDTVTGPLHLVPALLEHGLIPDTVKGDPSAVKYADFSDADKRSMYWSANRDINFVCTFRRGGGKAAFAQPNAA